MRNELHGSQRLEFLDVIRGLAALLVLVEHGLAEICPPYLAWSLKHVNFGQAGVVLFLIVSGFIIPASLQQGTSNGKFWLRRFFRLFPAYWFVILVTYMGTYFDNSCSGVPHEAVSTWLLNCTMTQGFFGQPHVSGVFWTLHLELTIYGICSLLFSLRTLHRSTAICITAMTVYACIGLYRPLIEAKPFCIGGLRYLYFAPLIGLVANGLCFGRISLRAGVCLAAAQIGSLTAIFCVNHLLFPQQIRWAGISFFVSNWALASFVFCSFFLLREKCLPKPMKYLGKISYSLYLLHPVALAILSGRHLHPVFLVGSFLLLSLLFASTSFHFIESPGIALGRCLEKRWRPTQKVLATNRVEEVRRAA